VRAAELMRRPGPVEDFDEPRTKHGKWRVSARQGWAGEKGDFFSTLLSALEAGLQKRGS
jgi:hypothetical protein